MPHLTVLQDFVVAGNLFFATRSAFCRSIDLRFVYAVFVLALTLFAVGLLDLSYVVFVLAALCYGGTWLRKRLKQPDLFA